MGRMAEAMAVSRRHAHVEDVRWLHRWAEANPQGRVIQLGAGSGTMAVALFEGSSSISLWSVDLHKAALDWEGGALENVSHWARYPTEGHSLDVAAMPGWEGLADLIIFDTSHEYDLTRAELLAWLPLMRGDAVALLHDYNPMEAAPRSYPDVQRAADEVIGRLGWTVLDRFGWSAVLGSTGTIASEESTEVQEGGAN